MAIEIKRRDYFGYPSATEDRIGNDLMLLDAKTLWQSSEEPYLADATNAIFFTHGSADIQINMVDHHIVAPCMVILMEGMVVKLASRSADSAFDALVISKRLTDSILTEGNVSVQLRSLIIQDPVFPIDGHGMILKAFNYLLTVLVRMSDNPYRIEAVKHMTLTLFCGFALSRLKDEKDRNISRKDEVAKRFLGLVRENYGKERSVAWYADAMCLTPKYLSQVVKDITGKPALDWIDEFTIVESKALLKSTDLTIDQISTKLNFMSSSLFGKYFKRVTGLSPREYRMSLK